MAIMAVFSFRAISQVAINADASKPHASAILDISSTSRGLLVPRMTQAQRNAIALPATGLMLFQSDITPGYFFNAGTPAAPVWTHLGGAANPFNVQGNNADDGGIVNIGNADFSHRLILFGGRENDPNPFISWKQGDPLRFVTDEGGWSEKMRITSEGKVGIGISNPSAKLDIAGNVNLNSNQIINLGDPVNAQDAATKAYVDAKKGHYVGEMFGGGVVFYVDNTGQHGLIADFMNLSGIWSNVPAQIGATAQSTWDGFSNSLAIYYQAGMTQSAAKTCFLHENWTHTDDWFLPSLFQVQLLHTAAALLNYNWAGNSLFEALAGKVWTSTEDNVEGRAKAVDLSTGEEFYYQKSGSLPFRPIRNF